jgi:hypothetical protein
MRQKEVSVNEEFQPPDPTTTTTTYAEDEQLDEYSTENEARELSPAEVGMNEGIAVMEGEKASGRKERKLVKFLAQKEARKLRHTQVASVRGSDRNNQEARHC